MASQITVHVLDVALGEPGRGIAVRLEHRDADGGWSQVGAGVSDAEGRVKELLAPGSLRVGIYRVTFETGPYLMQTHGTAFYPEAAVTFEVAQTREHHHVPLVLSPFGYTTYRGSR